MLARNFLHKIQMLTLNTRELYGKPMRDGEFNEARSPLNFQAKPSPLLKQDNPTAFVLCPKKIKTI
ncbi:hypothetical protein FACHB389_19210 [Nostoc calcicola FACHB-389]|nr:hypothetical protein FACHB389_19210 [Nostoc calcicola FACHB-389]